MKTAPDPFSLFGVVSPERVDMTYDAAGRMTALARSSDLAGSATVAVSKYAYDAVNRLTTITHQNSGGTILSSFGYTLDAAGRLTAEARTSSAPADTLTYSYTNNDQLTSVAHSNGTATETFGFDANGNRDTSGYATAASNQTTSDGTYNYAYDAQGNLISKTAIAGGNATTYAWDNRDRLTTVVQVVGGTTTTSQYTYDAMNRLIKVAVNGATTRETLYDGQTPLLDFNASGAVAARYLSVPGAIDELLARQTSSGVAWYLDDREGTVRDLVNNAGTSIDHIDYGAFGNLINQSSPANGDRFSYAGMESDANTGLYYDRARWYDPKGGKFVGQDPIGFSGNDTNIYRYVENQTPDGIDPSGLAPPTPGGYWGGWFNPGNWYRGLTTTDPNASDEYYNATTEGLGAGYQTAYDGVSPGASIVLNTASQAPGPAGYMATAVNVGFQTVLNPNLDVPGGEPPRLAAAPPMNGRGGSRGPRCPSNTPPTNPITVARLPDRGKIRFCPPKNWSPGQNLPKGPKGGFKDRFGNEWVKGPSRTNGEGHEWDVQIGPNCTRGMRWESKDGKHVNVSQNGEVTH